MVDENPLLKEFKKARRITLIDDKKKNKRILELIK